METFVILGRTAARREGKRIHLAKMECILTEWMLFPRAPRSPSMTVLIPCDCTPLQASPEFRGIRHGLGVVRRLMEQIGGTAHVVSDRGTEWTLAVLNDVSRLKAA